MNTKSWQPTASLDVLRLRAGLLNTIRHFFKRRNVLEVETPLLSQSTVSDPHLDAYNLQEGETELFLQTSPEYAMKRLLAGGYGPIYQICKAFRREESGRWHSREFSILEWYRPGFDHHQLMTEVAELVTEVLGVLPTQALSYRQLFMQYLNIEPHTVTTEALQAAARSRLDLNFDSGGRDVWLNALLTGFIEPQLKGMTFIYDYPASQAALARIEKDENGVAVGRRFELYIDGVELANGYFELRDPKEQQRRFVEDNKQRRQIGKPERLPDTQLLAALDHGLPGCSGVALGLDRLLMIHACATSIEEVISFGAD